MGGSLEIIGDHLDSLGIFEGSIGIKWKGFRACLKQMMMDGGADKDSYRDAIASKNYYNFY